MGRSRSADPDGYLDADRGSSSNPSSKRAELLDTATAGERAGSRDGARELDVVVESMPGLTRQQRDDAQVLEDDQRRQVQRVDRAIQTFERANDRGHVVYSNVEMPATMNTAHLQTFVRKHFAAGSTVHFDRFTMTTHTLHEAEPRTGVQERTAVFEIQTRRGAYLGASDGRDDTAHLLPRGMRFTVAGAHPASYRRPDGTLGTRTVIQLIDTNSS
jgi:hypothetical protein